GVDDVHAGQACDVTAGEGGVGHVRLQWCAVEMRAVAVDVAERAEIERAEGLYAVCRGLDHIARGMDLVVEHDEHTLAVCLRATRDLQRIQKIGASISAERACRALCSDQDDRL